MCGIVGVTGRQNAAGVVYERLKLLEYRGYDSAGITSLQNGLFYTAKRKGRVYALGGEVKGLKGATAIGHTRWATHGSPSDKNAHPHVVGRFAVVHNGIIENYAQLKAKYFAGVEFASDTDSEVIARLLDKFFCGDILSAVSATVNELSGSYALAIMCSGFDGIIVARHNNPAIVGYGDGALYVASDSPALAGLCGEITLLKDGDIAVLKNGAATFYDSKLCKVQRERVKNPATASSLDLNGCPHYMLKEIREVPASIKNTCAAYPAVEGEVAKLFEGAARAVFVGCGTAYNSGLVARRYFECLVRMPAEAEIAGEFRYKNPVIDADTVVVAISQSGETADTVEAAKLAKARGARVIAVTNSPYSQLTGIADVVVPVEAGQEICVAATKSYTGQLAALYLMAHSAAGLDSSAAIEKLNETADDCAKFIAAADIDGLAEMCARSGGVYFLGRDIDYAVALEGSLKLKEISYVPGEGYPAGELKHGTLALIDITTTSIVLITGSALAEKSKNAVQQVLSRRGKVIIISNISGIENQFAGKAQYLAVPRADKFLSPFVTVVALQLIAYKTALLLDRDPDKPRNLAKSVTVE